jgi:hypothetical protein
MYPFVLPQLLASFKTPIALAMKTAEGLGARGAVNGGNMRP